MEMTSSNVGGNTSVFTESQGTFINQLKDDKIRKQLYEKERKAQENWVKKWGFLKNPKNLWEIEAVKRGLPPDIDLFEQKQSRSKSPFCRENKYSKIVDFPSKGSPGKSSGMIGWRLFSKENNLNLLAGPLYISRKRTINPPLSPEEPDPRTQRIIFFG